MENESILLPVPLGAFKPHSAHFEEVDIISTLIADVSYVSHWNGIIVIESYLKHDSKLVGFELCKAGWLVKQVPSAFMPTILMKSLIYDWKNNKQHKLSKRQLLQIYWPAFWLTLRHPSTWWVR